VWARQRIGGMEKRREEAQKASRELNDLLTQLDRKRLLLQEKRSGVADKKASLETVLPPFLSQQKLTCFQGNRPPNLCRWSTYMDGLLV
jgi:hypothetical protein